MYNVSEAYKTAIEQTSRRDKIEGTITLKDGTIISFTNEDLKSGTLTLDNQCVNGEELEFGTVYAGQVSFTITTEIDRYKLFDAEVKAFYYLQLPDGTWEEVPLGIFYVSEPIRRGADVAIKALDAMIKFNVDYDNTITYGAIYEVLLWVCEKIGVEMAETRPQIEALCNGDAVVQVDEKSGCGTYVDIVAECCRLMAAYATIDRTGKLHIGQFGKEPVQNIPADQRFNTEISDFLSSYMGIIFSQTTEKVESYDPEKTEGLIMQCDASPFLQTGLAETKQKYVDNIRSVLCALSYTPSTVSFAGNPAIDLGDVVSYTVGSHTANSIVTSFAWKYRDSETLKGVGKNPFLTNRKSAESKRLDQLQDKMETDVTTILTFENAREIRLKTTNTQIVRMLFVTLKATPALFTATILIEVTNETDEIISFQYWMNSEYNTTHIPTQTIKTGKYTVTLTFPIGNAQANTTNDFRVFAAITGGSASIEVSHIKAAIMASGVKAISAEWDGTFTIEETFDPIHMSFDPFVVTPFTDAVSLATQTPSGTVISDAYPAVSMAFKSFTVVGLSDYVGARLPIVKNTIIPGNYTGWVYNARYVKNETDRFVLAGEFISHSAEIPIDNGRECALTIQTSDLENVTSVEVV